ncbi:hypothetical protein V2J09_003320 [Rumex salicifolius]
MAAATACWKLGAEVAIASPWRSGTEIKACIVTVKLKPLMLAVVAVAGAVQVVSPCDVDDLDINIDAAAEVVEAMAVAATETLALLATFVSEASLLSSLDVLRSLFGGHVVPISTSFISCVSGLRSAVSFSDLTASDGHFKSNPRDSFQGKGKFQAVQTDCFGDRGEEYRTSAFVETGSKTKKRSEAKELLSCHGNIILLLPFFFLPPRQILQDV